MILHMILIGLFHHRKNRIVDTLQSIIYNRQVINLLRMTDQENHLKQVLTQQKTLVDEINALNNQITSKREMAVKLQGIAEYLDQLGVKIPEETEEEAPAAEATPEATEEAPTKKDK